MRKPSKPVQLTSYNDLLGIGDDPALSENRIIEVPLEDLHPFKNHPFHVVDDKKMEETVESIRNYGVLNPGLVRPRQEGGYEIISGHRRKRACELAGKEVMPVMVKKYSDDESIILMVDSNIQREDILPSEKAFAYKMKMDALKHQGIQSDMGCETADLIGKDAGESGRTVQRYIRLTKLIPELVEMVDRGKIKLNPAVALSYLSQIEQEWTFQCIQNYGATINGSVAAMLKKYSETGGLLKGTVELILLGEKTETEKITLQKNKIKQFFPKDYSNEQMMDVIYMLLKQWQQEHENNTETV